MTKKLFIAILLALCGGCASLPKESACQKVERLKITEFDPDCYIEKAEIKEQQKLHREQESKIAMRYAEEDLKQQQADLEIVKKEAEAFRTQQHINRLKAEISN